MSLKNFTFQFQEFADESKLSQLDVELLNKARAVTKEAYAPYSNFCVGAAARLLNGEIVTAANQENASFPAGICAERTLLSSVVSQYPNTQVNVIAISYDNKNGLSNHPISPCGICRQSLVEFEKRFNHSIQIILAGKTGKIIIINTAADLLPLGFNAGDLV
jgi:cytidine deaminase